jgi:hypothetical protein
MSYLTYFNQNTGLSADFIPLTNRVIKYREWILESLTQREYIPIREEEDGKVFINFTDWIRINLLRMTRFSQQSLNLPK